MRKILLILFSFFFLAWRPLGVNQKPVPFIYTEDPRAARDFVYVEGARFYLHGELYAFKGMNYYPSKNSWRRMWESWDPHAINTELALLENTGVNTVRIFLDYDLFEKNRAYGDSSIMLARLDELLSLCNAHGMRALVTPFVWGRGKISTDKLHIRHIVIRFKDDSRVFGWDISNELDHYWIDMPSRRSEIQRWAEAIFAEVKAIDINHPVTAGDYGWYFGDRSDPYGSGITLDLSKMSIPIQYQDFICFHWYEHYFTLEVALKKLKEATLKPVIIEELGLPTGGMREDGTAWYLTEEQVAIYYTAWLTVAESAGAYTMPWCGFDYDSSTSPFGKDSIQNYWGMYDANYRLKATGAVFRDFSTDGRYLMKMLYSLPAVKQIEWRNINVDR
jgi:endo-1,4-beta-mannosidase